MNIISLRQRHNIIFAKSKNIIKSTADSSIPIEYPTLLTFHCRIIYNYLIKNYTLLIFSVLYIMKGLYIAKEQTMNFGNSRKIPLNDSEIVDLYWERNEKAIEETDYKYRKYLFSVAYNAVHDKLDSEECLNDTYLAVWNAIPPTKPNVLKAFLITVTRRIAIKRYYSISRKRVIPSEMTVSLSELEDFLASGESTDSDFRQAGEIISDFVRRLPERRRFIFMSRYYVFDSVNTIASDLNVSRSTVNKELAAIRNALKEKLESEGYLI